jgi:hypothetical protein
MSVLSYRELAFISLRLSMARSDVKRGLKIPSWLSPFNVLKKWHYLRLIKKGNRAR